MRKEKYFKSRLSLGNDSITYRIVDSLSVPICVYLWLALFCFSAFAQTIAPGAPGKDAQWATAGKQGVGTSASLQSKVWFTLAQGVMTEVYYPDVTVANTHLLQFVVVNPKTKKVETEQDDAIHQIRVLRHDSLSFQQINTAKSGEWKITKTYTTDPQKEVVLIHIEFDNLSPGAYYEIYVYYDPSLGNSGKHDSGWTENASANALTSLIAQDGDKASALVSDRGFSLPSNGFLGVSDGLTLLKKKAYKSFRRAENGNLVQMARLIPPKVILQKEPNKQRYNLAIGFAKTPDDAHKTAIESLTKGFDRCQAEYESEWADYVKTLRKVDPKYQAQFNMAAMILKAHEDKANRGANIASLTVPWGGGNNANEANVGGYHLVWSRDLYQVATAFMALGDKDAAIRALDFLFKVQQKPDGSFPQNSWLDGRPFWNSIQMDEVAYPLILAHELGRHDKETYEKHVKKAADYIVKNGPITPQERWEEKSGYSPSTIAAEIAGLVCAAEIAKKNGDADAADRWLKTADEWAANIEKWTVTTTGKYGDGNYYLRITQKGNPNAGDKIDLGNGAGVFDERDVVDAGFLELVRLGIKSPDDPLIAKSLKVIDQVIRVKTPNGDGFYRYNNDGYGEMDDGRRWNWDGKYTGKGRLWALLSGERGQYHLARYAFNPKAQKGDKMNDWDWARVGLDTMLSFANDGLMIPEQVWDKPETPNADKQFVPELKFGEGTGSATPLAWSMAQFIRLAVNLLEKRNLDTPKVVYDRYVVPKLRQTSGLKSEDEEPFCTLGETALGGSIDINKIMALPALNPVSLSLSERAETRSPQIKKCNHFSTSQACDSRTQMQACFVYKSNFDTFDIAGDFTGWKPKRLNILKNGRGQVLAPCLTFSKNARVEYKLIVDGKWITDPLNPNKIDNGVGGENSILTMPGYKPTEWANSEGMTKDAISFEEIDSKIYGYKRRIQVYVPEGMSKQTLPALYLNDGSDYFNRASAITIQRNLVKARKIRPFIMVFLDPKDRMKEYWANDDYARHVAEEVVPFIDKKYKTIKSREGRALIGASLGGITSIWAAIKYPKVFSRIGAQSSSFWVDDERVVKQVEKLDGKTPFKFYLDDGTLEGAEDTRKVCDILRTKNFSPICIEGEAGHNWTAWRDRLAEAFIAIWH